MKIKLSKICTGNLEKVTQSRMVPYVTMKDCADISSIGHVERKTVPYKENVPLIKIRKGLYVNLDKTKSLLGKIRLRKLLKLHETRRPIRIDGEFVMDVVAFGRKGNLVVKEDTVEPVYGKVDSNDTKKLERIRKDLKYKNISS